MRRPSHALSQVATYKEAARTPGNLRCDAVDSARNAPQLLQLLVSAPRGREQARFAKRPYGRGNDVAALS
jgi:hypothetical protein